MSNCKVLKLSLLLFYLLFILQVNAVGKQSIKRDTVSLQQNIEVPGKALNEFKKSNQFIYNASTPAPSLFQRFIMSLSKWVGFEYVAGLAPYLVYIILILAFVLLMIVLFRSKFQGIFISNRDQAALNFTRNEIADHIDFEALLSESLRQNNYNLAIRYLYLILLRLLHQKKLISYKLGKTNYEYINEISNKEFLPQFRSATHNYEYAWYGQFLLDKDSYESIASEYQSLIRKIND